MLGRKKEKLERNSQQRGAAGSSFGSRGALSVAFPRAHRSTRRWKRATRLIATTKTRRYRAGGAGGTGWPGTGPWNQRLGRFWSHDHAERIVVDPDTTHVWLITKSATFREFGSLAAAGPRLRPYGSKSPSDEYRQLSYDDPAAGGTGGWQLLDLDGTVTYFLASGLWDKTVGKNPANVIQGTYSGSALTSVSFPDGRSETYTYDGTTGKLASITEVGVAAGDSRTWTYIWGSGATADDLMTIRLPDGRSYSMFYSSDPNFPGYLTRVDLVGLDNSHRVETAWSYDANGNISQTWPQPKEGRYISQRNAPPVVYMAVSVE
jgi:hypothetical protein